MNLGDRTIFLALFAQKSVKRSPHQNLDIYTYRDRSSFKVLLPKFS